MSKAGSVKLILFIPILVVITVIVDECRLIDHHNTYVDNGMGHVSVVVVNEPHTHTHTHTYNKQNQIAEPNIKIIIVGFFSD